MPVERKNCKGGAGEEDRGRSSHSKAMPPALKGKEEGSREIPEINLEGRKEEGRRESKREDPKEKALRRKQKWV
eukprot:CAMPEP_0194754868 /NCGR_PEP_ID=MMETSP0323_2-20130528/8792_1 /TAXON_ID=2866 ORGANISM="Crypthecodinium cohnii, Strain Seligo" /NCGR_SAMPLE_ID=MMETSP0323_2 /ASSEMBLY_ACC=CAM_ASM_000346 /LENGTH=73 /DNA_ID=CAMNT_0039673625 /DNA_START=306 /DNA_END=524 /DNA_ORIENTATION=-